MRQILTFSLFFLAFYSQIYAQNTSTYTVYFDSDSDVISAENESTLDAILTVENITKIRIEGHTDSEGNDVYNRDLSQRRADAVRQYLTNRGLTDGLMSTSFFGENAPITQNQTDDGKQLNRRVVITVFFDIPQENPVIEPPKIEEVIVEETPPPISVADSVSIDNSLLNSMLARQLQPEFFNINNQRDTMIRTQSGILFYFNQGIFGGDCPEEITIKVTDYSSRSKAILANAPTLSNGRLLYSAGMFEIRAFCGDLPVNVRKGEEYNIFLPVRDENDISERVFKGFYGMRDSLSGVMNWQPDSFRSIATISGGSMCGGRMFTPKRCFFDRIYKTKKRRRTIDAQRREFYRVRRERRRLGNINFDGIVGVAECGSRYLPFAGIGMGFINCDAFLSLPEDKATNVLVDVRAENNTKVWIVFASRFSALPASATYEDRYAFRRIPKKEEIWVVATKINENGKPMLGLKKANTSDGRISLEFEEMESEEALAEALRKVDL